MTDNDIIKVLECCMNYDCVDCPISRTYPCRKVMGKTTLDLINRQQETIETLRNCVEQHHIIRKDGKSPLSLLTEEIKAEAIKEFAERFEEEFFIGDVTHSITKEEFEDFCKRNGG